LPLTFSNARFTDVKRPSSYGRDGVLGGVDEPRVRALQPFEGHAARVVVGEVAHDAEDAAHHTARGDRAVGHLHEPPRAVLADDMALIALAAAAEHRAEVAGHRRLVLGGDERDRAAPEHLAARAAGQGKRRRVDRREQSAAVDGPHGVGRRLRQVAEAGVRGRHLVARTRLVGEVGERDDEAADEAVLANRADGGVDAADVAVRARDAALGAHRVAAGRALEVRLQLLLLLAGDEFRQPLVAQGAAVREEQLRRLVRVLDDATDAGHEDRVRGRLQDEPVLLGERDKALALAPELLEDRGLRGRELV
jgi:hypothetical protein